MAYRLSELDNGITVITDRIPGANLVSAGVWIRVGSRDEEASLGGISHFVEHALFRGSANFSGDEIISGMENMGADIDAETGRDYTCYRLEVAGEHLRETFPMLLDMVASPTFDANDIARERKVIVQEIYETAGDYEEIARQGILGATIGKSAFARPIRGTVAKVSSMSRDAVAGWHARNYRGSSIVVSAAGNVRHGDVVAMARKWLGHLPKGRRRGRRSPVFKPGSHWTTNSEQSAGILAIVPTTVRELRDIVLGNLYCHYLGTGLSSRLYKRLSLEKGISYGAGALHMTWNKTSFIEVTFDAAADERIEGAVRTAIDEVKTAATNLDDAEVDRAKRLELKSLLSLYDTAERRAQHNAEMFLEQGQIFTQRETEKAVRSIETDDLRAYANGLVRQGLIGVAGYGPRAAERHFQKARSFAETF